MKAKLSLPALTEAKSPFGRPIEYHLFSSLGLAAIADHFAPDDELELQVVAIALQPKSPPRSEAAKAPENLDFTIVPVSGKSKNYQLSLFKTASCREKQHSIDY